MKSHDAFELEAGEYEAQCAEGLALSGESKAYFARGRLTFLRAWWDATGRNEPRRVIDFGSGVGDVTALLAETFPKAEIIGLERSHRCLELARENFSDTQLSFRSVDEPHPPADLVHLNGVVHHVPPAERTELFRRIHELTVPRGAVALFENNPLNPGTRLVMRRIPFDRDAVPVGSSEIRRRFRQAGMVPLATRYLFYFPHVLRFLRLLEPGLTRIPLGAQYVVIATGGALP